MSCDYKLQIDNVSMIYRGQGGEDITALKNVNLNIRDGEFVSLLGPSGCGKTTLLRLVADLLQPTSGQITISGLTPREARKTRQYGMVFQSPVLYDWRNIRDNICLPLEIMKKSREEQKKVADEMLELVGLNDFADRYPYQLSGGMQQRVGIARALAINPKILLMDEPFSALDEFTRNKLQEDLLRIWSKTNKTVIFVTHNISEALFLSDRVCVLTPHPGILASVVDIDLPRPRTDEIRDTPEFMALLTKIRKCFVGVQ
ncbi:MAG: ABC transporter ATP-binding protein [Negativicutes bacterium]|nr:ABC transporter ATP-binding protein [Negativicutes bacterium]